MLYIYELYDNLNKMYYIGQRDSGNIEPEKDKYMGSSLLMHEGGWFLGKHFEPIFENPDWKKYITKKILYYAGGYGSLTFLEILTIEDYRQKYGIKNVYNISDGGHGRGYLGDLVCERISVGMKKYYQNMTNEEKKKYLEWRKTLYNDESRLKMSKSAKARGTPMCAFRDKSGKNNPMFGKNHTKESNNKQINTKKEKFKELEIYGAKGRKWYHNPNSKETSYFSKLDKIPEGWILGRGPMKKVQKLKISNTQMRKNLQKRELNVLKLQKPGYH
jgi:hypothetical protein